MWWAGTPADVIKTRIMNDSTHYRSSWHCLVSTVRAEGYASLWKGFLPTWLRMVRVSSISSRACQRCRRRGR